MEYKVRKHLFSNKAIDVIEMKNDEIEVHVTPYGCTIIAILVKDKEEHQVDVILGFDDMDIYESCDKYIGALVGRCAGRIKNASFSLEDKLYHLEKNNGKNTLHGGLIGFDKKLFDYEMQGDGICFHYVSVDKEEGYPGNLKLDVTYSLSGNKLLAKYQAYCDQDTLVNITNHMYFNLAGKGNVLDHELQIHADEIICCDEDCCANENRLDVTGTPFDFRTTKTIGKDIDKQDKQLIIGGGYDHYFVFKQANPAVILKDVSSGIVMEVSTNQKGCQLYTANFLDGNLKGKNNWYYKKREGVCIETQAAPNAIHIEKNPTTILRAGEEYLATTIYEFKTDKINTKTCK